MGLGWATGSFSANFDAPSRPPPPVEEDDPVLHKARAVFAKLFQGFPAEDADGDDKSVDATIAIKDLMVRKNNSLISVKLHHCYSLKQDVFS